VTWRFEPAAWWNDTGDHLWNQYLLVREAQHRSGSVFTSELGFTPAGTDDLLSRGNGNVNFDFWLDGLGQKWQSARIGKWRLFTEAFVFQEGNEDYTFEAGGLVEHYTREDLTVSVETELVWSRDWLLWQEDTLLASFHKREASVAANLNWFPAPSQELRVKLQWLGIDAYDATPYRLQPSGDLLESTDVVDDFRVNNLGLQIRYRWTFAPQSDFYVVYGRGGLEFQEGPRERGLGGLFQDSVDLRDSDSLIVKARYRF